MSVSCFYIMYQSDYALIQHRFLLLKNKQSQPLQTVRTIPTEVIAKCGRAGTKINYCAQVGAHSNVTENY